MKRTRHSRSAHDRRPAPVGRRGISVTTSPVGAAIALAASSALIAGCQSNPPASTESASPAAHALAHTIGQTIGRCWFGDGENAFAGYIYSPEPNAVVPRVLIVRKKQPAERPVLVVEATGAASVTTYGPLLQGPNAGRIQADVDRWAKGGTSCS